MQKLRLYRGITVSEIEADSIIEDVKINGLDHNKKQNWGEFRWKDLRNNIDSLYQKEDLKRVETSPASVWVNTKNGGHLEYTEGEKGICFADKLGAEYYATKHNVTKTNVVPLLITVDVELENIAIDGRDFLYTVFGFIDPRDLAKTKRQTKKLKKLFGNKIEYYVEKIIKHPNSDKFAICDLAIVDNEIILDHSKNEIIIEGRHGTTFRSAFFGKIPIQSNQIISIQKLPNLYSKRNPEITLHNILEK